MQNGTGYWLWLYETEVWKHQVNMEIPHCRAFHIFLDFFFPEEIWFDSSDGRRHELTWGSEVGDKRTQTQRVLVETSHMKLFLFCLHRRCELRCVKLCCLPMRILRLSCPCPNRQIFSVVMPPAYIHLFTFDIFFHVMLFFIFAWVSVAVSPLWEFDQWHWQRVELSQ